MKARAGVLLLSGAALAALSTLDAAALQSPAPAPKPAPLVIQVGVDLIQMDASVTDKKGQPVVDLKAEDFILEVDGRKQPLTNAAYFGAVPRAQGGALSAAAAPRPGGGNTIIFIVDDLNMSFGSMYYARRGLRHFASEWGSSGTRAAIRTTSEEAATFTLFTTAEPFENKAAALRYNIRSNQGIRSVRPMPQISRVTAGMSPEVQAVFAGAANPSMVSSNLQQRLYSLVSTINSMRSLPGRKALVFVSEGFASLSTGTGPLGFDSPFATLFTIDSAVREAMRLITEVANRASVVLYTVDPRGLFADFPSAEDDPDAALIGSMMQARGFDRVHTQGSLQELAGATGGLAVINRNDLQGGFSDIVRDQSAYYLIGFEPTQKTFVKSSGRAKFHKIRLKVNRPDVRVRTRAGFYGVTDEEVNSRAPLPLAAPETY